MRLLVCEFITGGGLIGTDPPAALVREGELMLQQVVKDLSDCRGVETIEVLRDPRLPVLSIDKCTTTPVNLDFWQTFTRSCEHVDAVLPIAPETDDALLSLTRIVTQKQVTLLNSRPAAVRLTGSKLQTVRTLQSKGVSVVPTYPVEQAPFEQHDSWVLKPDQGVGGEDCRLLAPDQSDLPEAHVLQPFVTGQTASISLLCANGRAVLAACNEQRLQIDQQGCHLQSLRVNGLSKYHEPLQSMADAVAAAIPDLWGWVGVDLILTGEGPRVLEINPRLTSSYAGLHESLNDNPAQWLLDRVMGDQWPSVDWDAVKPVEIPL